MCLMLWKEKGSLTAKTFVVEGAYYANMPVEVACYW